MSNPLDLTITGKPTPRTTERVNSARKIQRPLSANRSRNIQSNIFGSPSSYAAKQGTRAAPSQRVSSAPTARNQQAKGDAGALAKGAVISREELEAVKAIGEQDNDVHSKKSIPEGVPKLQLGNLVDKEDKLKHPMHDYRPAINTPNSAESVSWGTPLAMNRPPSGKKAKGGGWQVNSAQRLAVPVSAKSKKHEDVPSLDLCLSNSNEGLKELAKVAKQVHEDIQIEYIGAASQIIHKNKNKSEEEYSKKTAEHLGERSEDVSTTGLNKAMANVELEKLEETKKQHVLEERLLVDELSRANISEQAISHQTPKKYDPKQQRHQDLFGTQSPITGSPSENSLLKRLRFGARILTRNGHDANREINGFFFPSDSSITMYEFRQFGTRSNALPFIQRNCYAHLRGFKKGKPFTILDIAAGKDLHFETRNQVSLPDSLKLKPIVTFRITELDCGAKEKLIYDKCKNAMERAERTAWVDNYESAAEKQQRELLTALRGSLQEKIRNRAVKTMTNMAKRFRRIDKSGDGVLDKSELKEGLREFRLDLREQEFEYIWEQIDVDGDGKLDYGEFIRGFLGEMNEFRKNLVRKVFARLDTAKSGTITKDDLKKFFSAKKHPKVLTGELKEMDVVNDFLSGFDYTEKKGEISYAEFQDYYEGVSIQMDTDNDFAVMMRHNWGL